MHINFKKITVVVIVFIISTLFSIFFQGFDYPCNNNVFHIPVIFNYAHTTEGPHDIFHESLDRYVSGFWKLLSLFATEKNIYYIFLGLHYVIRFLTIFIIWQIATLNHEEKPVSAILVSLILFFHTFLWYSPVGRSEILTYYLTHSQVVVPFVLATWWCLFIRKFLLASVLVGIAININAFVSIWTCLVTGIVMIVCLHKAGPKRIVKEAGLMAGIFFLLASPTIFWIFRAIGDVVPHEPFSYRQYLKEWYPYHNFIDVQWWNAAMLCITILVSIYSLYNISAGWNRNKRKVTWIILSVHIIILFFGAALPYLTDSRLLLNLFPLRMDAYFIFFFGIIILTWCIQAIYDGDSIEKAYSFIALFSLINGNMVLLLVTLFLGNKRAKNNAFNNNLPWILIITLCALHIMYRIPPNLAPLMNSRWAVAILVLQTGVIALFMGSANEKIENAILLIILSAIGIIGPPASIPITIALASAYMFVLLYMYTDRFRKISVMILLGLTCITISYKSYIIVSILVSAALAPLSMIVIPYMKRNVFKRLSVVKFAIVCFYIIFVCLATRKLIRRGGLSKYPAEIQSNIETQSWARENTPPNTTFLPIGIEGFSTLSRRPVWIEWKIGGMVMWSPENYSIWHERFQRLKNISTLAGAIELACCEKIEFIVFDKRKLNVNHIKTDCKCKYQIVHDSLFYSIIRLY